MSEVLAPILSQLPPVPVMLSCLAVGTALVLILGLCMAPWVAVVEEWRFVTTERSFFKKLARQIGFMAFVPGTLVYLAVVGGLAYLAREEVALLEPPYREALLVLGSLLLGGYLLLALYVLSADERKQAGIFHHLCGILTCLVSLTALAAGTVFLYRVTHTPPSIPAGADLVTLLRHFYLDPDSRLLPYLLVECLPLGCAAAGALGGLWLILMRNRQDYGRDYYQFAMRRLTAWCMAGLVLALPLAALSLYMAQALMLPELSGLPGIRLGGAAALAVMLCLVSWWRVRGSQTPMRHKISVLLGLVCLCLAVSMQVYAVAKMLPSP